MEETGSLERLVSASKPLASSTHKFLLAITKPGLAIWNEMRRNKKARATTDRAYGGPGCLISPLQMDKFRLSRTAEPVDRPEWVELYYSDRLENLDAVAFSLPDYNMHGRSSELPMYGEIGRDVVLSSTA